MAEQNFKRESVIDQSVNKVIVNNRWLRKPYIVWQKTKKGSSFVMPLLQHYGKCILPCLDIYLKLKQWNHILGDFHEVAFASIVKRVLVALCHPDQPTIIKKNDSIS